MSVKPDHGEKSYQGSGRLEGRTALITGGDSGIGRAVAIAYARESADVAISCLPEEENDARQTAQWIERTGRKAVILPGDIRDENHCIGLVRETVAKFGRLDLLLNDAAFQMTHDEIERVQHRRV